MGIHQEAQAACKLSSPPLEQQQQQQQQTNVHVYPDWPAMQAYYGPTMAVSPYFNPAVAVAAAASSGHGPPPPPPPYMWGPPQHMMPPPYAAFYPHGGVYAHHPAGPNLATTPLNNDSPAKSSGDSDRGLIKKLKGFDGLAMSIGNVNGEGGNDNGISHSSRETEGSSEGSDGNTTEGGQNGAKRSRERSPSRMTVVVAPSAKVLGSKVEGGGVLSPNSITELNLKNIPSASANMTSPIVPLIPNGSMLQNDREVKRERRKQSNRDSARRSRLRKQAEAEELSIKVEALNNENLSLRSEINILTDNSDKLKLQNAKLLEKLNTKKEQVAEDLKLGSSVSTANLLSRVDNGSDCLDAEMYENNKNHHPDAGGKLRQLLDASPRADAVAAR